MTKSIVECRWRTVHSAHVYTQEYAATIQVHSDVSEHDSREVLAVLLFQTCVHQMASIKPYDFNPKA